MNSVELIAFDVDGSGSQTRGVFGLSLDTKTTPGEIVYLSLFIAAPGSNAGAPLASKAGMLKCSNTVVGLAPGLTVATVKGAISPSGFTCHPIGVGPSRERTSPLGKR